METVRSLSGSAQRTKQGRTLATIPKSTSTMSPSSGKFVIQDFRGRAEIVPNLVQGLLEVKRQLVIACEDKRSESGRGQPHSKTLPRFGTHGSFRKVLECGGPLPLFDVSLADAVGAPTFLSASGNAGTKPTGMSALQRVHGEGSPI